MIKSRTLQEEPDCLLGWVCFSALQLLFLLLNVVAVVLLLLMYTVSDEGGIWSRWPLIGCTLGGFLIFKVSGVFPNLAWF